MTPSTEPALRLATMMHRRPTTEWSEREVKRYKQLVKSKCFDTLDDLTLLERYYQFQRRKGDNGIHRRDLLTLLNNFQGELDRARAWDIERTVHTPYPKQIKNGNGEKPVTDEEFNVLAAKARSELERFKADLRRFL